LSFDKVSEKTVLLTGANGFIGRHLLAALAEVPGVNLVAVVRSATGLSHPTGVRELVIADPLNYPDWLKELRGIDSIVHVAGIISPPAESESVEQGNVAMMRVNRDLTKVLAEAAVEAKVNRFIYLSSMSVYGGAHQNALITPETPVSIDGIYPKSKYAGEQVIEKSCTGTAVGWIHIRPPMVVGQGTKGTFYSMANLCVRVGVSPFGSIRSRYPIVQLKTLSDFVAAAITVKSIDSGVYLVGEETQHNLPSIIDEIASLSGRKVRHLPIPLSLVRMLMTLAGKRASFDQLTSGLTLETSKAHAALKVFQE
jgi:UDP-glucose 4-epimerase